MQNLLSNAVGFLFTVHVTQIEISKEIILSERCSDERNALVQFGSVISITRKINWFCITNSSAPVNRLNWMQKFQTFFFHDDNRRLVECRKFAAGKRPSNRNFNFIRMPADSKYMREIVYFPVCALIMMEMVITLTTDWKTKQYFKSQHLLRPIL